MPNFTVSFSEYTVAEYCGKVDRKELIVNKDYQRTDGVWPDAARSFLIESALIGFPIPKLSVRAITDLKTRKTTNEIVDGQQRTKAIHDYFNGKFAISSRSEIADARNKTYDELPAEFQQAFVSYRLQVDVFSGATGEEIRELFRRINSYTVSLNHEEKRHAEWQGEMKWFIYQLCRVMGPVLGAVGVLTEKQLARMQDAKLLADVVFAIVSGIQTTKPKDLDNLYRDNDSEFGRADEIEKRIQNSISIAAGIPELRNSELSRTHNFYSLLLAIMHLQNPLASFRADWDKRRKLRTGDELVNAIDSINRILGADEADVDKKDLGLWKAAESKTNTKENRLIRFKAFCDFLAE